MTWFRAHERIRRFCSQTACLTATTAALISLMSRGTNAQVRPRLPRDDVVQLARLAIRNLPFDSLFRSRPEVSKNRPIVLLREVTIGPEPIIFRVSMDSPLLTLSEPDVSCKSANSRCYGSLHRVRASGETYGRDTIWVFLAIDASQNRRVAHVVTSISFGGAEADLGFTFYFRKRQNMWRYSRYSIDAI